MTRRHANPHHCLTRYPGPLSADSNNTRAAAPTLFSAGWVTDSSKSGNTHAADYFAWVRHVTFPCTPQMTGCRNQRQGRRKLPVITSYRRNLRNRGRRSQHKMPGMSLNHLRFRSCQMGQNANKDAVQMPPKVLEEVVYIWGFSVASCSAVVTGICKCCWMPKHLRVKLDEKEGCILRAGR